MENCWRSGIPLQPYSGKQVKVRWLFQGIVLTAQGEETFELRGFAQGVDDFVAKPFSCAALAARIAAVLNRAGGDVGDAPSLFAFGALQRHFVISDIQ